jgi:flavodoxin
MKTLIVYYSHTGNNKKLAYLLCKKLNCDIHKISEAKKRRMISIPLDLIFKRKAKLSPYILPFKEYERIIFIGPIWGNHISTPMKAFIEREKHHIDKYGYVTVCNGQKGQKEKIISELTALIQHSPIEVMELPINSLLPEKKKIKRKNMFRFFISKQNLKCFETEVNHFLSSMFDQ